MDSNPAAVRKLMVEVLEVLGIDPEMISDLAIRISPDDLMQVDLTRMVWNKEEHLLASVFENYLFRALGHGEPLL